MAKNDAAIRNLENQVGQLANALKNRPQGALPSDTEVPCREGKEQCHAITLRSGTSLEEPEVNKKKYKDSVAVEKDETSNPVRMEEERKLANNAGTKSAEFSQQKLQQQRPPPPFPQRFEKHKQDQQFKKFTDVLKQLHINIPLVEALEQMPNYVKFMKDILTKKRRFGEFETVALTSECSAVLQNKLPQKLKDPGSFTIPCSIGEKYCAKALCYLGASIDLMPMSIFKKLEIGEARPTTVTLQLADKSVVYPEGKIEDVLVKVDKFIFPVDFIVLDYEADAEVPIILGRPFLATGRTLIDVQKGELTMRVQEEQVTVKVFPTIKFQHEVEECSVISTGASEISKPHKKYRMNSFQQDIWQVHNVVTENLTMKDKNEEKLVGVDARHKKRRRKRKKRAKRRKIQKITSQGNG